jgi:hypothetical protein
MLQNSIVPKTSHASEHVFGTYGISSGSALLMLIHIRNQLSHTAQILFFFANEKRDSVGADSHLFKKFFQLLKPTTTATYEFFINSNYKNSTFLLS